MASIGTSRILLLLGIFGWTVTKKRSTNDLVYIDIDIDSGRLRLGGKKIIGREDRLFGVQ